MAIYYVDLENGVDANNGTTFALRKKTIASACAAAASNDTIRVMSSPDPINTGINATFTDRSRIITLASAVTQTIHDCETAWTAAANVTATASATAAKCGTNHANLVCAAGFGGGLVAYKATAFTDYSAYQQVSFWFRVSGTHAAGVWQVKLCSDAAGATPVHTINVPVISTTNTWIIVTTDIGSALSASIGSVAVYRASGSGAATVMIDQIFASKAPGSADAITLASLISKNDGTDIWWPICGIDGTTITLDGQVQTTWVANTQGHAQFHGTTETVALWRRETIKGPLTTAAWQSASGGSYPLKKYVSCGWNRTDMTTLTGETWIDNLSQQGTAFSDGNNGGFDLSGLAVVRWSVGISIGVNGNKGFWIPAIVSSSISEGSTGNHGATYINCPVALSSSISVSYCGQFGVHTFGKIWNAPATGLISGYLTTIQGDLKIWGCYIGIQTNGTSRYAGACNFKGNFQDIRSNPAGLSHFMRFDNGSPIKNQCNLSAVGTNSVLILNDPVCQGLNRIEMDNGYARQESGVALENFWQGSPTTTADSAALSITGDIDVRVKLSPGNCNTVGTQLLLSKYATGGNQRSYMLWINASARLGFQWSTDGSSSITVNTATNITQMSDYPDGAVCHSGTMWVRATLDVDNGAGGYTCNLYSSIDGLTWELIGSTVTGAGTTSIYNSTAPVEIGSYNGNTADLPTTGRIYRAQIYNGIAGTLVFDANFETQTHGTTSFSDGLGNTIALANSTVGKIGYPGRSASETPWRLQTYHGSSSSSWQRMNPLYLKVGTVAAKSGVPVTISAWLKQCIHRPPVGTKQYASVPDSTALGITSDIEIIVDVAAMKWVQPYYNQILFNKDDGSSNREWDLFLTTDGKLQFSWQNAGSTWNHAVTTTTHNFVDGVREKIRVTLDVDNGAGGNTVTFYKWSGGAWVNIGSAVTAAGTSSIKNTSTAVALGGYVDLQNASTISGYSTVAKYYQATIKNSSGTTVLDFDFTAIATSDEYTFNVHEFTDAYSNTMRLFGAARIISSNGVNCLMMSPISIALYIQGMQFGGPTTNQVAALDVGHDAWTQKSITFTPTADTLIDVQIQYFGHNTACGWVGDVTATGQLLNSNNLKTLDIIGDDGVSNLMLSGGTRSF